MNDMKKWLKIAGTSLLILLMTSCGGDTEKHTRDIFAMDTYMSLTAYGDGGEDALKKCGELITDLEKKLSVTNENSDIRRINHTAETEVSPETAELIGRSLQLCRKTDGCLDITVYPVLKAWGFTSGEYIIPDEAVIKEMTDAVGYEQVELTGNSVKSPEIAEIDLGAVAKGYTSDRVIGVLRDRGIKSAIVSLGGNVQTLGKRPDGKKWSVAIRDPFDTDTMVGYLYVGECAVVTSGNYERYFIGSDGKRYCHIIDPATGSPVDNGLASVTVIGESGLTCDGLSTALFVMGEEKAVEFWKKNDDFDMVLITEEKKIVCTEGIVDNFDNKSSMKAEVVSRD